MKDMGYLKFYASGPRSDGQDVLISVQTTSQRMIRARFIRIKPRWYGGENPCMRFEIIGCNFVCSKTPLGMESGAIADHQITASSVLNNDYANYGTALARLNSKGSWCGQRWTSTWIQVNFLRTVDIYGLIIQGRYQSNEYVTEFYLKYGYDENSLIYAKDNYFKKLYASGPRSDGQDVLISVQTTSQRMIQASIIRIEPWWYDVEYSCMRFEIFSCN
ncbi:EGF-like repeat and discoidin I-like domain-containing protein 3 [Asterias amurensis]|uniref:EGF-like repeat and discoidin I-like domain-containing protein 3 n=1 Tax=Asterias amurensis TaxID=7602 RepID=UPI003AB57B93